mmetsp:Transcript_1122/g.1544  ORF Transcript_1122/g.1544 Transcript_1122/m.1544 type:complete len:129 (-) Transcript_1122:37-423(-)
MSPAPGNRRSCSKSLCKWPGLVVGSCKESRVPSSSFGMASIVEVLKDYESTAFADYKGAATGYHTGSDLMERCFVCVQYTDSSAEDTNSDVDNNLGMLMQNQYERERFYTCMKILKWATESRRDKQSV